MAIFRKKAVEVEAWQVRGPTAKPVWLRQALQDGTVRRQAGDASYFTIEAPVGEMYAEAGDWIVRDAHDRFTAYKQDIFEQTYDRVPDADCDGTEMAVTPEISAAIAAEVFQDMTESQAAAATAKTLHNSDISGARQNVKDIQAVGDMDMFQLLYKASSEAEGWMKSTKAMQVNHGCLVQVTTQQRNDDGSYAVAEALAYVPGVKIADDENGGRKLVSSN